MQIIKIKFINDNKKKHLIAYLSIFLSNRFHFPTIIQV